MTIKNGYYIAECTSNKMPIARKDANTCYVPFGVEQKDGVYAYSEYRFNLPIDYPIPAEEIIEKMTCMCENCQNLGRRNKQ